MRKTLLLLSTLQIAHGIPHGKCTDLEQRREGNLSWKCNKHAGAPGSVCIAMCIGKGLSVYPFGFKTTCTNNVENFEWEPLPAPDVVKCIGNDGYVKYIEPGRAFKIYGLPSKFVAWKEAQRICESDGGNLVTDDRPGIHSWLQKDGRKMWIGATDKETEGEWKWATGDPIEDDTSHWAKWNMRRGPDGKTIYGPPKHSDKDCANINLAHGSGDWNDNGCTSSFPFACERPNIEGFPCDSQPCQNDAECQSEEYERFKWKYICNCKPGFTGTHCETDINECASNPCMHGATCKNLRDRYHCVCQVGFTGKICEHECCLTSDCWFYEGKKSTTKSGEKCKKWPKWNQKKMLWRGLLKPTKNYCRQSARDDTVKTAWCFTKTTEPRTFEECKIPTCTKEGEVCDPLYVAQLQEDALRDFYSNNFETQKTRLRIIYALGVCWSLQVLANSGDGSMYLPNNMFDECGSNPCQRGARCKNGEHYKYELDKYRYDCVCRPGYTGINCETAIDKCYNNPCRNGAECINGEDRYECICLSGFSGRNCEIDPPCHGTVNLARGGEATAYTAYPVWSESWPAPGRARDAFAGPNKEWHSAQGIPDDGQWLQLKLNTIIPAPVCKISFLPPKRVTEIEVAEDCPKKYKFQGSYDGKNFLPLFEEDQQTCETDKRITKTFTNVEAFRFYRLVVLDVLGRTEQVHGMTPKFVVVRDLQFYGAYDADYSLFCDGLINWASYGNATAKTHETDSTTAINAFKGKSSEWQSANGMPQWLKYKMQFDAPVCKISFLPRGGTGQNVNNDCPREFKFQGSNVDSNDDKLWETLLTEKNQQCEPETVITKVIPNERKMAFKFYRLVIDKVKGRRDGTKYAIIRDLQFFTFIDSPVFEAWTEEFKDMCRKEVTGAVFCSIEKDVRFEGHNIDTESVGGDSPVQACKELCIKSYKKCQGFTLDPSHVCYLKSKLAGRESRKSFVSGTCKSQSSEEVTPSEDGRPSEYLLRFLESGFVRSGREEWGPSKPPRGE